MRTEQGEADDFTWRLGQDVAHGDEVALGLGHLDAANRQHPVVQPIPCERVAIMGADALSDLVLVVREDQIETTAMDVESFAELAIAHRGAFDVPARPPTPPRA